MLELSIGPPRLQTNANPQIFPFKRALPQRLSNVSFTHHRRTQSAHHSHQQRDPPTAWLNSHPSFHRCDDRGHGNICSTWAVIKEEGDEISTTKFGSPATIVGPGGLRTAPYPCSRAKDGTGATRLEYFKIMAKIPGKS